MTAICHLIIADDDYTLATLVQHVLEDAPFVLTIHLVNNGRAALAAYEVMSADLLVLDIHMPLLSGVQVVQRLRERGDTVPVLLISAAPHPPIATDLDPHTTFVQKPFDLHMLTNTVRDVLHIAER